MEIRYGRHGVVHEEVGILTFRAEDADILQDPQPYR